MKQVVKFNIQKTGFKLIELYGQLHNNHSTASLSPSLPCPHPAHSCIFLRPQHFTHHHNGPEVHKKKAKRPVRPQTEQGSASQWGSIYSTDPSPGTGVKPCLEYV